MPTPPASAGITPPKTPEMDPWQFIDPQLEGTGSAAFSFAMTVTKGELYIVYDDHGKDGFGPGLKVKKFDGSQWQLIGNSIFDFLSFPSIAVFNSEVYVAYEGGVDYQNRRMMVRRWNGTTWEEVFRFGDLIGQSRTVAPFLSFFNSMLYLSYVVADSVLHQGVIQYQFMIKIKKYDLTTGTWQDVPFSVPAWYAQSWGGNSGLMEPRSYVNIANLCLSYYSDIHPNTGEVVNPTRRDNAKISGRDDARFCAETIETRELYKDRDDHHLLSDIELYRSDSIYKLDPSKKYRCFGALVRDNNGVMRDLGCVSNRDSNVILSKARTIVDQNDLYIVFFERENTTLPFRLVIKKRKF